MSQEPTFGSIVKEHRRLHDLTQTELGRRVGCAVITIRRIEAGTLRPSLQIAERLAMALGIPLEERAVFIRLARTASTAEPAPSPLPTPPVLPEEIGLEDLSGRAIRGFNLGERLGAGGYGVVYRAVQPLVEREVAIKIILPQYANHPDFIRRFEAEAQLVARLEHPHIVPLYDYWREPGVAYLVMRLLRGGSLAGLLNHGPLPLPTVSQVMEQIGLALHTAHQMGVIHRDLKPANVLLDEHSNAYLADFGIAKNLGNPNLADVTQPGVVIGSPAYFSPEQIMAEPVRPQTDIYCLGIMLYELLTGCKPFDSPSPIFLIQQHLNETVPPLAIYTPGLSPALDPVIQKATAKDQADRYPDMLSLLADFRQALTTADHRPLTTGSRPSAISRLELTNPYKGLRAFTEADAADFFGRETLIEELLRRMSEVNDPTAGVGRELARFLAVVGPSGSGKSSVVKAGLIPTLRQGGLPGSDQWFIIEMLPGTHPWEELEATLLRIAVNPPESLLAQLLEDERGLLRAVRRILPADESIELVLIIDQFEELFTLVTDEAVRHHFLESLVTAVLDPRSRLRLVITLRADFMDRPLRYADFGELLRQRAEFVLPLSPDELEQAITGPAQRVGLGLESGLVAAISRDVGDEPGALPLLQYALTELFERSVGNDGVGANGHPGLLLTKQAYQATGGVLGALARRADELYAGLDAAGQEAARQLFLRLVTLGEGAEDTRRRVLRAEVETLTADYRPPTAEETPSLTPLAPLRGGGDSFLPSPGGAGGEGETPIRPVIETFGKHRLLSFDHDPITRGPTVEVAHEALLREWGRLREWLDASRTDIRMQRLLATAAAEWREANQDASFMLRGARLDQFAGWVGNSSLALTPDERAFLEASLADREARRAEEEARRQRELETAQKLAETEKQRAEEQTRAANQLRRRAVFLTAALVVAAILAVIAIIFGQQASQNEQAALTQQAIAQAEAHSRATAQVEAETQRQMAQVEASQRATAQAEAESQQAIAEANFARAEVQRLAAEAHALYQERGNAELTALLSLYSINTQYSPQGDAALAEAASLEFPIRIFMGHTDWLNDVAFSPDGKHILTSSNDKTARLWDMMTGQTVISYTGHTAGVKSVAFSPDGRYVLTGSLDKTARLWDTETGQAVITYTGHTEGINVVAFAPDGKSILTGSADKTARLWDAETGQEIRTFAGHTELINGVAFAPDGKSILTSSNDRTARLWDVETGEELQDFTGHSEAVTGVAFSPDGRYALTGSMDKSARLWDVKTGREIRQFLGSREFIKEVAYAPDGKTVLAASDDRTVWLWNAQTGEEMRRFHSHESFVQSVAISADGRYALSGGDDRSARLWDLQATADPRMLLGHGESIHTIRFSPDGKYILTGCLDHTARLWDAQTHRLVHVLQGHTAGVHYIAFSADSQTILTAGFDKTVRLWDVATGRELRQFVAQTNTVYGVALSPDNRIIVTTGDDADPSVKVWDAQTGELLHVSKVNTRGLHSLMFSPDGRYFLTSSFDHIAQLWDAYTFEPVQRFEAADILMAAAFAPDGKTVVTNGVDKMAELWDVETGQKLGQFIGHTDTVYEANFSPDGKYLVTASADKTARLWDVATAQEVRRFTGHSGVVNTAIFSPDGGSIVTGSSDRTARIWDADYHDTIAYVCHRLPRDFTDKERAQYGIKDQTPACPP
jgi:WD40 repeat protein/serine/threonine protein kinase/DNA-binding XRE family transcriptional regulator